MRHRQPMAMRRQFMTGWDVKSVYVTPLTSNGKRDDKS